MRIPSKPLWKGPIEEQINEAMERGEWDNLKGKGKPLAFLNDLADRRAMSTKLRRDANFVAPWQDVEIEIDRATKAATAQLLRALAFRETGMASTRCDKLKIERDFERALVEVALSVATANSAILKYNLMIPSQLPHLHRKRLKLIQLMEQFAPQLCHLVPQD